MFDHSKLADVLAAYKQNFVSKQWGEEKFKWEAVKRFQDNWDINATDFAQMLERSLDKTCNLLASANNFPKKMIIDFAKSEPEEVRGMFVALYDESKDVVERIDAFKQRASVLLEKYGNGAAQHYQNENAVSTYLWLRYPDIYYIYKYTEVSSVANKLKSELSFKKGAFVDNIRNFLKLYDEIDMALKEDNELVELFRSQLTDTCYPDPELRTLTVDVGYYISKCYSQKDGAADINWHGTEFDPGLSVEDWSELLNNKAVFTADALEIMKCMKDYGGAASCKQLAVKYGRNVNFYNSGSIALARRICEAKGIEPEVRPDGSRRFWIILYTGRNTEVDEDGSFIWKLREELSQALDDFILKASPDPYTKNDFIKEVFLTESEYDKLRSLILRKKNVILQGAPGVGKTFSAKRLAYSIIGEKNDDRICMVQFHQNYSYEDFIMGYRPDNSGGFELKSGVFFNFCERCKEDPDKPYFFIIDEINRGNLSKIFGELLMLIETDKRGESHKLSLVYSETAFYVPENLHIIGLMNTADRSLAMIDYALRRRFSFYTMKPAFNSADKNGFDEYTKNIKCRAYHNVIACIKELNNAIRADSTLGRGFEIGHSYFAPKDSSVIDDEWVRGVVEYEIVPLIEEYWFDDDKKVEEWTRALFSALGDRYDR